MTAFPRIDPHDKTDRELIVALLGCVEATHSCIDSFRSEQSKVNSDAAKKRHQTNNAVMGLEGSVKEVVSDVGKLRVQQGVTESQVSVLTKALGISKPEPGEKRPRVRGILGWPGWALVGASSGILVVYKVVEPLLEPAFRALNHAILAVH